MKHLPIKSKSHRALLSGFESWLHTLGYSERSAYYLPIHAREFLHRCEAQGITEPSAIRRRHAREYMAHLSRRGNMRTGAPLGNAYLAKQLQAVKLLSRCGRLLGMSAFTAGSACIQPEAPAIDVLTSHEVEALYNACGDDAQGIRDRAMLSVYYGCGLRRAEGRMLDLSDFLPNQGLLYVRHAKGARERYVPMGRRAMADIAAWVRGPRASVRNAHSSKALLLSRRGTRMQGQSCAKRLAVLAERAGMATRPTLHTLRHSIATHLLAGGMSLRQAAEFLGHSSLESTQRYTHISQLMGKEETDG